MSTPPVAPRRPVQREHHGHVVVDDYAWLSDVQDPEVLAYLRAENAYTEARLAHLAPLRESVFEEIRARTQESDLSVPAGYGPWWYYSRSIEGRQYSLQCRSPRQPGEPRPRLDLLAAIPGEEVLIDGNEEAADSEFFALGACEVSVGGHLVALAIDRVGDERYDILVRRIDTREVIDTALTGVAPDLVWSLDDRYLFYTRLDDAWRPHQVWRHEVGTAIEADVCVHTEADERFWTGLGGSRDDRWVYVVSASRTTSEVWLLDAADPTGELRLVAPREEGVEYTVEVAADRLLITHNVDSPESDLAVAPLHSTSRKDWAVVPIRAEGERLLGIEVFDEVTVASLRRGGLTVVRILPHDPDAPDGFAEPWDVAPDEAVHTIATGTNLEPDITALQVVVESLVTPRSVYDVDLRTREWSLLRRQPVLGGYDRTRYAEHRLWARAGDGVAVPISLVHRVDVQPDGTAPGLLYGYGAYEVPMDPWFSVARLSLLDRGVVVAIAHVRGGGEMGRWWYEAGRLGNKMTSMTDFLACADELASSGWVAPGRLVAEGGSAGGLLVGAAAMLGPQRFAAVLAEVPFVDALTTMLDPSLPLTVTEWDEWGNPLADPAAYDDIAAYSPYELVAQRAYPSILATTSLQDTRVSYAEAAKWVARLRAVSRTDEERRPVLLRTETEAGHAGRSGRYDAWREVAFEYAYVLDRLGVGALAADALAT